MGKSKIKVQLLFKFPKLWSEKKIWKQSDPSEALITTKNT
jgi:hypothetical protein